MKKLALGALFVGLMACGGGKGDNVMIVSDAGGDTGPGVCNPLGAPGSQGCNAGEKCTWIEDQANPRIGHVGCAPDGTIEIGAACTVGEPGPMGYDNCKVGGVCLSGECKQVCDTQGGTPACDANHSCTRYSNFFVVAGNTVAGVCDPACDPLTQDLKIGANKIACGSTTPDMPNKGCYGYSEYSCAPALEEALALTDREPPLADAGGNHYLNGCAPGFIPLFFEGTGSMTVLCTGVCAALEIDNTTLTPPGHPQPLSPDARYQGDPLALGKHPTDAAPVAGHATCSVQYRGSSSNSECRFLWPYLVDRMTGELPPLFDTMKQDTIGVCLDYTKFGETSCRTKPRRSADTPGMDDDAADEGCQKVANTMFAPNGKPDFNPALNDIRVPTDLDVQVVRHNLH